MDEKAALWAAVLGRLGACFPLSPFGRMGREDVEEHAVVWAGEMREVPAAAISELYERACRKKALGKDAGLPPNIGDFRAAWLDPDWDYWAEVNKAPEYLALPSPGLCEGLGARTAAAQNEHRRVVGEYVCCECVNGYGVRETAVLSLEGDCWVCGGRGCGFRRDF